MLNVDPMSHLGGRHSINHWARLGGCLRVRQHSIGVELKKNKARRVKIAQLVGGKAHTSGKRERSVHGA
jgi:hypothetical protein